MSIRSASSAILDGFLVTWLAIAPLFWILRDGLGPNAVDTSDGAAIVRFLTTFWWGPVLILLIALRLAVGRPRRPEVN